MKLCHFESLDTAVASLADGWLPAAPNPLRCCAVEPAAMVQPYRRLLVHHEHMTTTLEAHYGGPIELRVLKERCQDDTYARLIVLAPRGSARIVEVGIARLHLRFLDDAVRGEVLAGRSPLGEILIRHDVLRRIDPRWYFRLEADEPLLQHFGRRVPQAYGRLGVIYCDHQPAVELLEIVAGAEAAR